MNLITIYKQEAANIAVQFHAKSCWFNYYKTCSLKALDEFMIKANNPKRVNKNYVRVNWMTKHDWNQKKELAAKTCNSE